MLTEKTYDTGQVNLRYMEGANNGKPLVFVHDLAAYWRSYSEVIPHFENQWHVYAVDLRGHGASSRAGEAYRLLNYSTDIVNFVRDVAGEAAVLWGHGLGANAVLTAAVTMDIVDAIILEDLKIDIESPTDSHTASLFETFSTLARRDDLPPHIMRDALRDLRVHMPGVSGGIRMGALRKDDYMQATAEGLSMVDGKALAIHQSEVLPDGYTPRRLLDKARCPVLYMSGDLEQGSPITPAERDEARRLIKQGTVAHIPKAGRTPHRTQTEAVVARASAFLADI